MSHGAVDTGCDPWVIGAVLSRKIELCYRQIYLSRLTMTGEKYEFLYNAAWDFHARLTVRISR